MIVPQRISRAAYGPLMRGLVDPPPDPAPAADVRLIGKYRILRKVGEGGMAVVHEAEDPELRRRVALKVLRGDSAEPRFIQRLHREAAIAAQLRHANIVRIHEVGMATDSAGAPIHFIAMDFVEGITFGELLAQRSRSRRELLALLETVADAVAYAHEQGVVHRDLKPGNVLVDTQGHVALADFGLARSASFDTPLTRSNAVMGTPQYMAPEQVEGRSREVDVRSDVYALGVMLYEILAGRLPFRGESLASLYQQILSDDPVRPTRLDRTIDHDLEWICLKAMEKDPDRRYPSGRAFQQDLKAWLEERPVSARPPSMMYRLRKRIRRHRAAVAVAGVALLVLAGVAIPLAFQTRQARELALVSLRKEAGAQQTAALAFRRTAAWDEMGKHAKRMEEVFGDPTLQDLAEPHYLLGRMRRAMMDEDGALAAQEKALAIDASFAPALYERIVLNARRYRLALGEAVEKFLKGREMLAQHVPVRTLGEEDPAASAIRNQIREDLKILMSADHDPGPGATLCAQGLLAWSRGDIAEARRLLRQAVAADPFLEEGYEGLATLDQGSGDPSAALQWWTAGWERDRGCLPHLEGRAAAHRALANAAEIDGDDPISSLELGIIDLNEALNGAEILELASKENDLLMKRSRMNIDLARARALAKRDTKGAFEAALRDLDKLTDRRDSADAWIARAYLWMRTAEVEEGAGRNPAEPYGKALVDADKAVSRDGDSIQARLLRAVVLTALGGASHYRRGSEDLDHVLRLRSDLAQGWSARGRLHQKWGLWKLERGEDALPMIERAVADFGEALTRVPGQANLLAHRADARRIRGALIAAKGGDPRPEWELAVGDYTKAIEFIPGNAALWSGRAYVHLHAADYERNERLDPSDGYRRGIKDMDRAIELNPGPGAAWFRRGTLRLSLALSLSSTEDARGALSDLTQAAGRGENSSELWKGKGAAEFLLGRVEAVEGRDPSERYRAALEAWENAVAMAPALAAALQAGMDECRRVLESSKKSH